MEDSFRKQEENNQIAKFFSNHRFTFWLTAVGVFLFVLVLIITWFSYRNFTNDELINFAPVDSVVYFSAHDSFWPWQERVLTELPYDNFYSDTSKDFAQNLLSLSSHTAYFIFLIDNRLEPVWLFKLDQFVQEDSFVFDLPTFKIYNNKILVVGSAEALEKVDGVVQGDTFSLASQISISQAPVNFYISAQNLKTFLNLQNSSKHKILSQLLKQDLYLQFNKNKNIWQINFNQNISGGIQSSQELITKLPADFNIFISKVNLSDLFSQWASADEFLAEAFAQTQEIYEQVFNFDLSAVGKELLNNFADIIIFTQDDSALGLDYVLVMSQPSDLGIESFKKLVKVILAQKLPKKALRYLPDGSSIIELSADTEAWQWQIEVIEGSDVFYITEPVLDFSIYYSIRDGQLLISGTQERLMNFIQNSDITIDEYRVQCSADIFKGSYVIFAKNSQIFDLSEFLPTSSLILGNKEGCLPTL